MPTLKASLARSAESYAKRALVAYVEENPDDFVVFGGIAVELAVKAKLAELNPTFLAENGKFFNWARGLDQAADSVEKLPPALKTVGAAEAVQRLLSFHPEFRTPLASVGTSSTFGMLNPTWESTTQPQFKHHSCLSCAPSTHYCSQIPICFGHHTSTSLPPS
jgi:hypothetical protein